MIAMDARPTGEVLDCRSRSGGFNSRRVRHIIVCMNKSDFTRMCFGFSLLIILAGLALAIALGKVEEKTSYGLMPLLTSLATLAGGFAQWAFSSKHDDDK